MHPTWIGKLLCDDKFAHFLVFFFFGNFRLEKLYKLCRILFARKRNEETELERWEMIEEFISAHMSSFVGDCDHNQYSIHVCQKYLAICLFALILKCFKQLMHGKGGKYVFELWAYTVW